MIEVISLLPVHWRPAIEATLSLKTLKDADKNGINKLLLFTLLNSPEPSKQAHNELARCLLHGLHLDDHVELLAIAIIDAADGRTQSLKRYLSQRYFGHANYTIAHCQEDSTVTN